jgi:hypothetical protein
MSLLDAVGWFGSALLVFSLMQARVLRFRIINTVACVILTIFNGVLGIWPMVAMNLVLTAINLWFIAKLWRDRRSDTAYAVLQSPATTPTSSTSSRSRAPRSRAPPPSSMG